jgi:hypothetical protein
VVSRTRAPDGYWYGNRPELLGDIRGPGVDAIIRRIEVAVHEYPYPDRYHVWPGPNSNTFTAWIGRPVPELGIDLPATAIGKDYLGDRVVAAPASGRGVQVSLAGLLGFTASSVEGLEFNVLGLSVGLGKSGLKLPLVGRIGPARSFVPEVKASSQTP